ncbi:hypothetical protein KJZ99_01405 [bacterium]|nr:hypothetical protein [bacterium]
MNTLTGETSATYRRVVVPEGLLLFCALVFLICVAACTTWSVMLMLATLFVFAVLFLRADFKVIRQTLWATRYLFLVAALLHVAFRLWLLSASDEAPRTEHLLNTGFFMVRLFIFVTTTSVLVSYHSPIAYAEAVSRGLGRFIGSRFAGQVGVVAALALGMVPRLRAQSEQRTLARRLRLVPSPARLPDKLAFVRQEFFATVQNAMNNSQSMALVLWSRGYESGAAFSKPMGSRADVTTIVSCLLFCTICLSTL